MDLFGGFECGIREHQASANRLGQCSASSVGRLVFGLDAGSEESGSRSRETESPGFQYEEI